MKPLAIPLLTALLASPPLLAQSTGNDSLRVTDHGAQCNGTADDTAGLKAALAAAQKTGRPLLITGSCTTRETLNVPDNVQIDGRGTGSIKSIGPSGRLLSLHGVSHVTVRALRLDGSYPNASVNYAIQVDQSSQVVLADLELVNPGNGIGVSGGSREVIISRPRVIASHQHGVEISDASDVTVREGLFDGQAGFGIIINGTSSRIRVVDNTTHKSGLELVGATWSTSDLIISGNHAANTGDNCYSLTGHNISFTGNMGIGCAGNGLNIYGHHVTATGNYFRNNSQAWKTNAAWRAGILIGGGWGGTSQHNVVTGNVVDDDQPTPTQQYGIFIPANHPLTWAAGQAVTTGAFKVLGLRIYRAINNGTSGNTPPTHTAGTASDGGVTWQYVDSYDTTAQPDFNIVMNNQLGRAAVAGFADHSTASSNQTPQPPGRR